MSTRHYTRSLAEKRPGEKNCQQMHSWCISLATRQAHNIQLSACATQALGVVDSWHHSTRSCAALSPPSPLVPGRQLERSLSPATVVLHLGLCTTETERSVCAGTEQRTNASWISVLHLIFPEGMVRLASTRASRVSYNTTKLSTFQHVAARMQTLLSGCCISVRERGLGAWLR